MTLEKNNLPKHIAIIMDGNGRWAKQRGFPRTAGHREGMKTVKKVIAAAQELGVEVISFFAFSTENWNRPKKEIDMLLGSLNNYLIKEMRELDKKDIKFTVSGDMKVFSKTLQENLKNAIAKTKSNKGLIVNLCLNYGGRADIINAAKQIAKEFAGGKLTEEQVTEELFSEYLYTKGLPDPDLLIRTSGEQRISNFLLWQLSYTELCFPKVLWPNFDKKELVLAIEEYQSRNRRFGRAEE